MSRQSAYKLRNRLRGEPFDIAWEAAFQHGYDALHQAALERTLFEVEVPVFHGGEQVGTRRHFNERLTVYFLSHRNDLKADRVGEIRRIAEFLDIAVAEQLWPELVEAAGFDAMKADSAALMPGAGDTWKGGGKTFLNKGTNGRWHDVNRAEDLARYDERCATEFSPALAAWCEHGRLVAGDPCTAAD